MTTKRKKIGVIFGGKSGEHEVSVQSAKSVMTSLNPDKYEVVPIAIDKTGRWHIGDTAARVLESASLAVEIPETIPADNSQTAVYVPGISAKPAELQTLDVVIPVMHGTFGEDGSIQGFLELVDVAYVGSGVLGSAVGLDKIAMKTMFQACGLPQVKFVGYRSSEWKTNPATVIDDVEQKIGYPCFVKPANLGSSVGISKAKNQEELVLAMDLAMQYDRRLIVEEGRNVREIEIAVLGNETPRASVPGEVIPPGEFYDYTAKYISGESELLIPARISSDLVEEIQRLAVEAFLSIDCSGLARVDFFIDKDSNEVLLNEINTMPGFTRYSMYPKLWEATGLSYGDLIDQLIDLAVQQYEEKQELKRSFDDLDTK